MVRDIVVLCSYGICGPEETSFQDLAQLHHVPGICLPQPACSIPGEEYGPGRSGERPASFKGVVPASVYRAWYSLQGVS